MSKTYFGVISLLNCVGCRKASVSVQLGVLGCVGTDVRVCSYCWDHTTGCKWIFRCRNLRDDAGHIKTVYYAVFPLSCVLRVCAYTNTPHTLAHKHTCTHTHKTQHTQQGGGEF